MARLTNRKGQLPFTEELAPTATAFGLIDDYVPSYISQQTQFQTSPLPITYDEIENYGFVVPVIDEATQPGYPPATSFQSAQPSLTYDEMENYGFITPLEEEYSPPLIAPTKFLYFTPTPIIDDEVNRYPVILDEATQPGFPPVTTFQSSPPSLFYDEMENYGFTTPLDEEAPLQITAPTQFQFAKPSLLADDDLSIAVGTITVDEEYRYISGQTTFQYASPSLTYDEMENYGFTNPVIDEEFFPPATKFQQFAPTPIVDNDANPYPLLYEDGFQPLPTNFKQWQAGEFPPFLFTEFMIGATVVVAHFAVGVLIVQPRVSAVMEVQPRVLGVLK